MAQTGSNAGRLTAALEELTAAPWEPSRWPGAVKAVAEATGGWCGHLIGAGLDHAYLFGVEGGLPAGVFQAWAQLGGVEAVHNPRARAIFAARNLEVITDDDFLQPASRARNAIYQTVYRPFDVGQSLIVKTPLPAGGIAIFTSMRPEARGPPSPADRRVMARLAPKLAGAVRLQAMLETQAGRLAVGVLEELEAPVFFLNARSRVTELSGQATNALQDERVLRMRKGRLEAIDNRDDQRFQAAVARVAGSKFGASELLLGTLSGNGPVRARIARLAATGPFGLSWMAVTLSKRREIPFQLLQEAGLTESEGQVASALFDGHRPRDIAISRGVTMPTALSAQR